MQLSPRPPPESVGRAGPQAGHAVVEQLPAQARQVFPQDGVDQVALGAAFQEIEFLMAAAAIIAGQRIGEEGELQTPAEGLEVPKHNSVNIHHFFFSSPGILRSTIHSYFGLNPEVGPYVDFTFPLNDSKLMFAKWGIKYDIIGYYNGIMDITPLRNYVFRLQ